MFSRIADREGYEYPEHDKLHIRSVVPLDEILYPKWLDAEAGRPRHGGDKKGEHHGYHCCLDEQLEVSCTLLQVH